MELRKLDPAKHAALVARLFFQANDFVRLTEGVDAGPAQVAGFFKGVPPGCEIDQSVKVGLFEGEEGEVGQHSIGVLHRFTRVGEVALQALVGLERRDAAAAGSTEQELPVQ